MKFISILFICIFYLLIPFALWSQVNPNEKEAEKLYSDGNYLEAEKIWINIAEEYENEKSVKREIDALINVVRCGMHISKYKSSERYAKLAAQKAADNKLYIKYGHAMNALTSVYEFLDQKDSVIYACQEVIKTKGLGHKYYSDAYSSLSYTFRDKGEYCLLYTSPSPRDGLLSRMPSSA